MTSGEVGSGSPPVTLSDVVLGVGTVEPEAWAEEMLRKLIAIARAMVLTKWADIPFLLCSAGALRGD